MARGWRSGESEWRVSGGAVWERRGLGGEEVGLGINRALDIALPPEAF